MKSALALFAVLALPAMAGLAQTVNPDARIVKPQPGQARSVPQQNQPQAVPAPAPPTPEQQNVADLRADLNRMRVLLNQMRTNLAFVQTSDTPLKHQFDLNNEMWQVLLTDMDRRLQKLEQRKP